MKATLLLNGTTDAGGSPLIMHNERLADPLDSFVRVIASISKKRNKTEADHLELARLEFLGGLYTDPVTQAGEEDDECQIVVPSWNVLRCLQAGATRHKRGKDVLRGVFPLSESATLTYAGQKKTDSPSELWARGGFSLRKSVGVQRARTMRTRPFFNDWQASLDIEIDPVIFDLDTLQNVWSDAGKYAGLGDMRPVYGRFHATIEESK